MERSDHSNVILISLQIYTSQCLQKQKRKMKKKKEKKKRLFSINICIQASIVGSDHSDHYAKRYRSVNDKVGNKRKLPRPSCNYTANRKVIYCLELELAGTRKQQGVPR